MPVKWIATQRQTFQISTKKNVTKQTGNRKKVCRSKKKFVDFISAVQIVILFTVSEHCVLVIGKIQNQRKTNRNGNTFHINNSTVSILFYCRSISIRRIFCLLYRIDKNVNTSFHSQWQRLCFIFNFFLFSLHKIQEIGKNKNEFEKNGEEKYEKRDKKKKKKNENYTMQFGIIWK